MKAVAIIRQNIAGAFLRFPVAFLASAVCFLLAVFEFKESFSLYSALACTCFWAISATLFVESRNGHKAVGILAGLAGGAAFFLIVNNAPNPQWVGFLMVFACVASMKVAPFLRKNADAEAMGFFCCSISRTIIFTTLVTCVLVAGGFAILASLHYLLGLPIKGGIYGKFWLFCTIFFAPVFAMGELPRDFNQKIETYSRQERIIIVNMLPLLMLIYAAILWLYIAKIAVLMELPKGSVAYMVSAFSLGGLLLYFFSSLQASAPFGMMRFWRRFFPLIISAPLVLLILAITTRIHAYGVTEDRYAVALFAAWLVGAVLWIAANRHNTQKLIWIYAAGVALVFLSSFGPWGAASVSQASQVARLEQVLRQNHLLDERGHIVKQENDVPKTEVMKISSIVKYLAKSKKITAIRPWFANIPEAQVHKSQKRYSAHGIMKDMGLQYTYSYSNRFTSKDGKESQRISFNQSFDPLMSNGKPFDIRGYDRMVRFYLHVNNTKVGKTKVAEGLNAEYDDAKLSITLTAKNGRVLEFPLKDVVAVLKANNPQAKKIGNIPVLAQSETLRGKIYVTSINGYFDEENTPHIQSLNIILLYQAR